MIDFRANRRLNTQDYGSNEENRTTGGYRPFSTILTDVPSDEEVKRTATNYPGAPSKNNQMALEVEHKRSFVAASGPDSSVSTTL